MAQSKRVSAPTSLGAVGNPLDVATESLRDVRICVDPDSATVRPPGNLIGRLDSCDHDVRR